jgi:hypothetical protein
VVDGARLESGYAPKGHQGFESLSLRHRFTRTGEDKNLKTNLLITKPKSVKFYEEPVQTLYAYGGCCDG